MMKCDCMKKGKKDGYGKGAEKKSTRKTAPKKPAKKGK